MHVFHRTRYQKLNSSGQNFILCLEQPDFKSTTMGHSDEKGIENGHSQSKNGRRKLKNGRRTVHSVTEFKILYQNYFGHFDGIFGSIGPSESTFYPMNFLNKRSIFKIEAI